MTTMRENPPPAIADPDWTRRHELNSLLRACRARISRPVLPGQRGGGLRQEDVASLAGIGERRYAALERGEFTPQPALVDQVAVALAMSPAERSALHVLLTGQDPPRPATPNEQPRKSAPSPPLRDMVTRTPYPAALTDETWTVHTRNEALSAWTAGWYDAAPPRDRHLIFHLFSPHAETLFPDVHAVRRSGLAMWRYQYERNLTAPGFGTLVQRLTATSPEAAALWAEHELAFPPHEYPLRLRHPNHGIIDAHVLFTPVTPRLWSYAMIVPPGIAPPNGVSLPTAHEADMQAPVIDPDSGVPRLSAGG